MIKLIMLDSIVILPDFPLCAAGWIKEGPLVGEGCVAPGCADGEAVVTLRAAPPARRGVAAGELPLCMHTPELLGQTSLWMAAVRMRKVVDSMIAWC